MNLAKNMYNKAAVIDVFSTYSRLIINEGNFAMTDSIIKQKPKNFQDLTGKIFSKWTVMGFAGKDATGKSMWLCQCNCGSQKKVVATSLNKGISKSCGCFRKESAIAIMTKHGNASRGMRTAEYRAWIHLRERCYSVQDRNYKNYGGRGITVCDRWLNSFENFIADMGTKPTPKHSIDRIDVNGNYEPLNCRWATGKEQGSNRRNNRVIEHNGERFTLSEWADRVNVKMPTLWARLNKGWDIEKALNTKNKEHAP